MSLGRLILPLAEPALSASGAPQTGAALTVYLAGTTTLASLYANVSGATAITNPQTSNSAGRFYSQTSVIWADQAQAYDCLLSLPDGETFTYDSIYVLGAVPSVSSLAPINSPVFTGVPQAPTPTIGDNSAKLATTAFVMDAGFAPTASPHFTGGPTAPTPSPGDNDTSLATTAFVQAALTALVGSSFSLPGYIQIGPILLQFGAYSLGTAGGDSAAYSFAKTFSSTPTTWLGVTGSAAQMLGTNSVLTTGLTVLKGAGDSGSPRAGVWYALGPA